MRQKLIYIAGLAILSLGMLLTSCTSEEPVPDPGTDNGGLLSDEDMHFSFRFRYGDADKTRAAVTDEGESWERYINSVRVVLYEGKQTIDNGLTVPDPTAKVLYAFDFYIKSKQPGPNLTGFEEWGGEWPGNLEFGKGKHLAPTTPDSADEFITYARKVEDRNYYMLVVLNSYLGPFPSANVRSASRAEGDPLAKRLRDMTEVGRTLADFTQPIPLASGMMDNPEEGGPAANNYMLMTNANGLVYVPNTALAASEDDAHDDPIATEVERAVAKVSVKVDNPQLPADVEIGYVTWNLVNTNKYYYWMRKQTNLITSAGTPGQHELLAATIDRELVYAEDPNFDGFSDDRGGTNAQRKAQFYTLDELYNGSPTELENPVDENRILYTLENTMSRDDQSEEVIPQTVFAVPYKPDNTYAWEDTWKTKLTEGYFIFNDIVISFTEMEGYATGTSIPVELTGLAEAITAVQDDDDIALDLTDIQESDQIEPFEEYGLKYYRYGINYYSVLIKHYNADPADGYGRYGVVRNNFYTVNVTEIAGPGSPVLTTPTYISALIGIQPWLVSNQDEIDAGEEIDDLKKTGIVTYHYIYEAYGYFYERPPARALTRAPFPPNQYGWHDVEAGTAFFRAEVDAPIPMNDEIIYKFMDQFQHEYDEIYEYEIWNYYEGQTVSEHSYMNEITIVFSQKKGQVLIHYVDADDTSYNFQYNHLELPNGMEVNDNTIGVRFAAYQPFEEYWFSRTKEGVQYRYNYNSYTGSVTADATDSSPKEMTLYYKEGEVITP